MSKEFEEIKKFLTEEMKKAYSEKAYGHAVNPRNMGNFEDANGYGEHTDSHGDGMQVWLKIEDDVVKRAGFWAKGCTTLVAAGSAMTELVTGLTVSEIMELTPEKIIETLEGLPPGTEHCADIAIGALQEAAISYYVSQLHKQISGDNKDVKLFKIDL